MHNYCYFLIFIPPVHFYTPTPGKARCSKDFAKELLRIVGEKFLTRQISFCHPTNSIEAPIWARNSTNKHSETNCQWLQTKRCFKANTDGPVKVRPCSHPRSTQLHFLPGRKDSWWHSHWCNTASSSNTVTSAVQTPFIHFITKTTDFPLHFNGHFLQVNLG